MAVVNRPGKVAGGTSVSTGGYIYASDWNGDVDTIYNEFNGNIDDANVKSAAGIDPSKLDDFSATAAEAVTIASPGTTDSPSAATDLTGELTRLRYNDLSTGLGESALYSDGSSNATVGPWDGARQGHNLVYNGSLQTQSGGAGTAPDGWSVVGTPSILGLTTSGADVGSAQILQVTGAGTADGVSQVITGLKADALYIIGCRARATTNVGSFAITGGLASGAFENTSRDIPVAASAYSTISLAVKANNSGGDITISITTGATSGDIIRVYDVFMYEVDKDAISCGPDASVTVRLTTSTTISPGSTDAWISGPAALDTISLTPHRSNQRVVMSANFCMTGGTGPGAIRLKRNGTVVQGPYYVEQALTAGQLNISFRDVVDNPTPGTAIAYTFEVWDDGGGGSLYIFAPLTTASTNIQTSCDINAWLEDIG